MSTTENTPDDETTTTDLELADDGVYEVEDGGSIDPADEEPTNLTDDESIDLDVGVDKTADEFHTVEYDASNTTVVSDGGSIEFPI